MSEDIKHRIVSEIKSLAHELNASPTRAQWLERTRLTKWDMEREFKTWEAALAAAGLAPNVRSKKMKLSNEEFFGRDLQEVLDTHEPKIRVQQKVSAPILPIGDLHFPFVHRPTLEKIYRFAEKEIGKDDGYIVQVGDLYDMFAHSKFPKSANFYGPDDELELGFKAAKEFWSEINKACPNAKKHGLKGNHDVRPLKLAIERAPSLEGLVARALEGYFQFDGVNLVADHREELEIDSILFHHGIFGKLGDHRDFTQMCTVVGHTHRGGVVYRPLRKHTLWELNCGFVGDENAKVLQYTPMKTTGWTLGWGFIDEYGPRFIAA